MRKDKKTLFSQYYYKKKQKREILNASVSLIIGGFFITGFFLIKMIVSVGVTETISFAAMLFGVVLIVLGTVIPHKTVPAVQGISRLFNRIGSVVIKALLIPIYVLTFLTTFWFLRSKKKAYRFETWENSPPMIPDTYFEKGITQQVHSQKTYAVLGSIFSEISAHKMYILLPLVVILLVLGLIFFFVSSSSVFSFIYTFI